MQFFCPSCGKVYTTMGHPNLKANAKCNKCGTMLSPQKSRKMATGDISKEESEDDDWREARTDITEPYYIPEVHDSSESSRSPDAPGAHEAPKVLESLDAPTVIENVESLKASKAAKASKEIKAPEDPEETKPPKPSKVSEEIKAPWASKFSAEIKAPKASKDSAEIKAPKASKDSAEIKAPKPSKVSEEIKAPKTSKVSEEIQAPKASKVSEEIQAPKASMVSEEIQAPKENWVQNDSDHRSPSVSFALLGRSMRMNFFPGSCRSGKRFRYRDLLYALRAPLDVRKLLVTSATVAAGLLLLFVFTEIAGLVESRVATIIGLDLGLACFSACAFLGMGISTRLTMLEARSMCRVPFNQAFDWVKVHLVSVALFPFLFVLAIGVLGVGIAVFHLLARIPYVGPVFYGLTVLIPTVFSIAAVVIGLLFVPGIFLYVPAVESGNLLGLLGRLWWVVRKRPGACALHLLVSLAIAGVIALFFCWLISRAYAFQGLVDRIVGGGQVIGVLGGMPSGLFSLYGVLFDLSGFELSGFEQAIASGVVYKIAGWSSSFVSLLLLSVGISFVLTYFGAAGVVSYNLLIQIDEE